MQLKKRNFILFVGLLLGLGTSFCADQFHLSSFVYWIGVIIQYISAFWWDILGDKLAKESKSK